MKHIFSLGAFAISLCLATAALADSPAGTLDRFHATAASADRDAFLALFAPEAVFLGTDGTERLQGEAFREFVTERFADGQGWAYRSRERHIEVSADGDIAWFDESLSHEQLGQCRGSGVLRRGVDGWRIAQYNLSIPIPRDRMLSVVREIQAPVETLEAQAPGEVSAAQAAEPAPPAKKTCRKFRHKTNKKADC